MAINQITTSNTFGEWIVSTQQLIVKYNYVEDTANLTYLTANSVYATSNTVNTKANLVFSTANNVANISNSINVVAASVYMTSNTVNTTSNVIFNYVGEAYNVANNMMDIANAAYDTVNTVYVLTNSANLAVISSVEDIDEERYVTFTSNSSGLLLDVNVATNKLLFNPLSGTLTVTNLNSLSDINLKTNIQIINNPIEIINKIDGISFNWKDNGRKSYGIIAQELEQILPDLVEGKEIKTVNYIGLIAFLINAVKDLNERLKILENS